MTANGHCLCGSVQFAVRAPLAPAAYCHCEDCRRCTGSAFNISVGVETADFALLGAEPRAYATSADSGTTVTRHFCGECGSPVYTTSAMHPGKVFVKAGLFDDPAEIVAASQSWTRSAVPWALIPPGLPGHDTEG